MSRPPLEPPRLPALRRPRRGRRGHARLRRLRRRGQGGRRRARPPGHPPARPGDPQRGADAGEHRGGRLRRGAPAAPGRRHAATPSASSTRSASTPARSPRLVREMGGEPNRPKPAEEYRAAFPRLPDQAAFLRFATDLENVAISAYADGIPKLGDGRLRQTDRVDLQRRGPARHRPARRAQRRRPRRLGARAVRDREGAGVTDRDVVRAPAAPRAALGAASTRAHRRRELRGRAAQAAKLFLAHERRHVDALEQALRTMKAPVPAPAGAPELPDPARR